MHWFPTAPMGAPSDREVRFSKEVRMSRDTERLLAEVLRLPESERAELVRKTIASLEDAFSPEDVEAAWADEVGRRVRSIEDGTARMLSREEFDEFVRRRP